MFIWKYCSGPTPTVTRRGTLSLSATVHISLYSMVVLLKPYTYCDQEGPRGTLSSPATVHIQYHCMMVLLRPYTYCDQEGDTELTSFALTDDDLVYKIPYIKQAQEMSDREVNSSTAHTVVCVIIKNAVLCICVCVPRDAMCTPIPIQKYILVSKECTSIYFFSLTVSFKAAWNPSLCLRRRWSRICITREKANVVICFGPFYIS